jgi:TPR repeat protein
MLQLAADQGHACAQFMLGKCLFEGKGIHKCDSKALFWFGCAAKQKFSPAENKLKVMDVTELHLAAARGDEDSVKRLLLMDEDIHSTDQCVKAAHNGLLSHFISCGFNN